MCILILRIQLCQTVRIPHTIYKIMVVITLDILQIRIV